MAQRKALNSHRYKTFEKAYRPKARSRNPLEKLKGLDGSLIPPCEAEVVYHIKRLLFVAKMWFHANRRHIDQHPLESDGWELRNGSYMPILFEGPQLPETLLPDGDEVNYEINDDEDAELRLEAASSDEELFEKETL